MLRRLRPTILFGALVLAFVPAANGEDSSSMLVHNGVFSGAVYVADDSPDTDLLAAQDLAEWLGRVFETAVEVRSEHSVPAGNASGIYIGNTRAGADLIPPQNPGDSYTIAARDGKIFIKANSESAIWGACSVFLREYLDIHFLMPGTDGAEWNTLANFSIGNGRRDIVPAWHWRNAGTLGLWGRHLGFGNSPAFSHNLYNIFTSEVLEQHPELRSVFAGTPARMRDNGFSPQPNLIPPSAASVTVAAAKKYFEKYPNAYSFSLGINDNLVWDESPESEEHYGVPVKFFNDAVVRSDYFYRYANTVAAMMPERNFGCLAYRETQTPPLFNLRENILPVLCTDRGQWFYDKYRSRDLELFERWGKSGARLWGIWEYYEGAPYPFPREFYHAQVEAIRQAHANGARLMMIEGADPNGVDCLKAWIAAQALADPQNANADHLIDRYCRLAFGPAAVAMKAFYLRCEKIWYNQKTPQRWLAGYRLESAVEIFSREDWTELAAFFDAAEKSFAKSASTERNRRERARLSRVKKDFERMRALADAYDERKALMNAPLQTLEDIGNAVRMPIWDKAVLPAPPKISISDPRPTKILEIIEALKTFEASPQRLAIEKLLEKHLTGTPAGTLLADLLRHHNKRPEWRETFERLPGRYNDEDSPITKLKAFPSGDWRQGKSLAFPQDCRPILYPSPNLFADITSKGGEVFDGEFSYKFSGAKDCAGFQKTVPAKAGDTLLFSATARGKLSVGSDARFVIVWQNAAGRALAYSMVGVPAGDNSHWRRYVTCSKAPAGTASAKISINVSGFGDEDFLLLDNLELRRW